MLFFAIVFQINAMDKSNAEVDEWINRVTETAQGLLPGDKHVINNGQAGDLNKPLVALDRATENSDASIKPKAKKKRNKHTKKSDYLILKGLQGKISPEKQNWTQIINESQKDKLQLDDYQQIDSVVFNEKKIRLRLKQCPYCSDRCLGIMKLSEHIKKHHGG